MKIKVEIPIETISLPDFQMESVKILHVEIPDEEIVRIAERYAEIRGES